MNPSKKRTEITLFLILVPFINAFNYYLTYNNISWNARTLLTFSIDTATGYASWFIVHMIIVWCDSRIPYEKSVGKRLAVQLISTVVAAVAFIIGSTILINHFATDHPVPVSFFAYDIPIISVWFLVMNGVYIALHFYGAWQNVEAKRIEESRLKMEGFRVKSGKQELLLPFVEIGGFWVEGEYVSCGTIQGKKYVIDHSIDRLEKALPTTLFFRINRQFMLHRQVIRGFERASNGKINVLIQASAFLPASISVSRTKASDFKNWFRPD